MDISRNPELEEWYRLSPTVDELVIIRKAANTVLRKKALVAEGQTGAARDEINEEIFAIGAVTGALVRADQRRVISYDRHDIETTAGFLHDYAVDTPTDILRVDADWHRAQDGSIANKLATQLYRALSVEPA